MERHRVPDRLFIPSIWRAQDVSGIDDPMSLVKTLWDNLNNPRVTNYNLLKNDDITIEDCCGKSIVVVNVPAAERQKRPIYVKNNINSGTFKRNHEGDYHCRMDEIREMIRESEDQSFDSTPVPSLGIDCFDMDTVARYLNEVSAHRPGHPWLRVFLDEFLSMSGATTLEQDGVHPTEAGLLMFGKVSCIRVCSTTISWTTVNPSEMTDGITASIPIQASGAGTYTISCHWS